MTRAPKRPTSIKVGHRDIAVLFVPQAVLDAADGDYLHSAQRIRIGDWFPPQTTAEVFLHELLHACWPYHWPREGDMEESAVSSLGEALAQVWRDNPHLVAWLSHSLNGKEA